MSASDGKALYYPYIHIQNLNWLKASLFYWDEISRIIPSGYLPKDNSDVKKVIDAGILFPAYPQEHHKDIAKALFMEKLLPLIKRYEEVGEPLGIGLNSRNKGKYVPSSLIDLRKFHHDVSQKLLELGLAQYSEEREGFLAVDQHLGGFYMTCLASAISEQRMNVYSDSPGYTVTGEFLENGRLDAATSLDPVSVSLSLNVGLPSLKALSEIEIDKIIAFHKEYSEERLLFRSAIEDIRGKLIGLTNVSSDDLSFCLVEEKNRIQKSIQAYQLRAAKIFGIPISGFAKISLKILLLTELESVFDGIEDADFEQLFSYVLGSEAISLTMEKQWFHPTSNSSQIARYMLPVRERFRQKANY
ncbi:MAG: hypothetical protein O2890_07135 [Cyanobacteria bacterium]|nr:hypothetical protein [Cyanobacteriota bacterium]MDA0866180.1 hypothetical protein [Cyanobacteriota bacterium]